jgi:signal transduction histidine kinase
VVQELFTNIIKHSGATKVSLELNRFDDEISLIVEDNGKGFDTTAQAQGIGLQNMQSRIAYLGGHLVIDSVPGRGTTAIVSIPIKPTA